MTRFNRVFIASALCALAVLASIRVPISGVSTYFCAINQTTCIINTGNCQNGDLCIPNDTMTTFSTCYAQQNSTCGESGVIHSCLGTCFNSGDPCQYTRDLCVATN
jgi:hypothetical protein